MKAERAADPKHSRPAKMQVTVYMMIERRGLTCVRRQIMHRRRTRPPAYVMNGYSSPLNDTIHSPPFSNEGLR